MVGVETVPLALDYCFTRLADGDLARHPRGRLVIHWPDR
jgi:hypothetical protein